MPTLAGRGPNFFKRWYLRLRSWIFARTDRFHEAQDRWHGQVRSELRKRLVPWKGWLEDARLWDSPDYPLEVRGLYHGRKTGLVCEPQEGVGCWVRWELIATQNEFVEEKLQSEDAQRIVATLQASGHSVILTEGRLCAARSITVAELDTRHLRNVFDTLLELAEALEPLSLAHVVETSEAQTCPFCHDGLETLSNWVACAGCGTLHHQECAAELTRCTVLGCTGTDWHRARHQA